MKKRWKIFWIVCGSLFGVGVILAIVGAMLGGSTKSIADAMWTYEYHTEQTVEAVEDEMEEKIEAREEQKEEEDFVEEARAVPIVDGTTISLDGVQTLDVDLSCFDITIEEVETDQLNLICKVSNHPKEMEEHLVYIVDGDEVEILLKNVKKCKNHFHSTEQFPTLTLQIPSEKITQLGVSIGAGRLQAKDLKVTQFDIEAGAGIVDVSGFSVEQLDVEVGTGEVTLEGNVSSQIGIECGIGKVDFKTAGTKSDYSYDIECGAGTVSIGDEIFSGLANGKKIMNGGAMMEVECGAGTVNIQFEK